MRTSARSLAVDPDIAYLVTYRCPRCQLELEAEEGGWPGWRRCPTCGTPSLPPEILLGHPATIRRLRDEEDPEDAILVIGDDDPRFAARGRDASAFIGEPPSSVVSSLRLLFLTGLVICLFILLVSFLDDNQVLTGAAAALALTFFLLLLRLPGRRRRR